VRIRIAVALLTIGMAVATVGCGGAENAGSTSTTNPAKGLPDLPEFRPEATTSTVPPTRDDDGRCLPADEAPDDAAQLASGDLDNDGSIDTFRSWELSERVNNVSFDGFVLSAAGEFGEVSQRFPEKNVPGPLEVLGSATLGQANEPTLWVSLGSSSPGTVRVGLYQLRDCALIPVSRVNGGNVTFEVGRTDIKLSGIRCEDTIDTSSAIDPPSKYGGIRVVQLEASLRSDGTWRLIANSSFMVDGQLSSGDVVLSANFAPQDLGSALNGFDTLSCPGISAPSIP